jgi:hypothetical protein
MLLSLLANFGFALGALGALRGVLALERELEERRGRRAERRKR